MIYRGVRLNLCPSVYPPSDDSYLLADNIQTKESERVLDMGTGCGILGIIASKMGGDVTSSDINEKALKCTRKNAELNGVELALVKSDLFNGIRGKYDLIMFNPPYLPKDGLDYDDELKLSWEGGDTGIEVTDRFLEGLGSHLSEEGRALIIQSSLSMPPHGPSFTSFGLKGRAIDEKPLFFEKLYVYITENCC